MRSSIRTNIATISDSSYIRSMSCFSPNIAITGLQTSSPKGNDRSPENKQVFLNSSLVSKRFFSIGQGQPTLQSMVDQILNSIKRCYSVANLQKKMTL